MNIYIIENSINNECESCDNSCYECSTLNTNCTSCTGTLYLKDSSCIANCGIGYFGKIFRD